MKEAETKAIETGLQENSIEQADIVIKKVLEQRQLQELAKLDADFEANKRNQIDGTLLELQEKHDKDRSAILAKHDAELSTLLEQSSGLTQEALSQKKLELLNKQQMEVGALDQKFTQDCSQVDSSAQAEIEAKHARDRLELREKHYQVRKQSFKLYVHTFSNFEL